MPEMRKPSALNARKIERRETPNDNNVRKLRAQDCLGFCVRANRGCNLVGDPSDITDRSGLAGAGMQQTGFIDQFCNILVVWPR